MKPIQASEDKMPSAENQTVSPMRRCIQALSNHNTNLEPRQATQQRMKVRKTQKTAKPKQRTETEGKRKNGDIQPYIYIYKTHTHIYK